MPRNDEEYRQNSADDSDIEGELTGQMNAPRLTSKDKGKGKANTGNKKSNGKSKEVYSWEEAYTRSWDAVQEDEEGSLQQAVGEFLARNRRKRLQAPAEAIQRTIIRHLVLVLDLSSSMTDRDMRPNRFDLTLEYAREFVSEWFDQNPLGQIGIVGMKEGIAERVCPLSGNPPDVLKKLADRRDLEPSGEPSLQNAIEMARGSMGHLPTYSSREILVIFGSLTTCDPGNIHDTLKNCVQDKIRVSVVALAAEMKICKDFCVETGGIFGVAMNEGHYRDMFFEHVLPPAVKSTEITAHTNGNSAPQVAKGGDLLMMGFPTRLPDTSPPALCTCHGKLKSEGYLCPRCLAKICDIPTDCNICDLVIVSAPHLARSYHHLFPVKPYQPV
ncbi:putative SSL1-TFIIH subunit, factor B [Serendipita vermifera]|nr:putative SSL1-TFIIH subunit, factor B [Serendipita vermifera]